MNRSAGARGAGAVDTSPQGGQGPGWGLGIENRPAEGKQALAQLLAAAGAGHHLAQGQQVGVGTVDQGGLAVGALLLLADGGPGQEGNEQQKSDDHHHRQAGGKAAVAAQQPIGGSEHDGQMQCPEADQRKRGSIDQGRADLELPGGIEQLDGEERTDQNREVEGHDDRAGHGDAAGRKEEIVPIRRMGSHEIGRISEMAMASCREPGRQRKQAKGPTRVGPGWDKAISSLRGYQTTEADQAIAKG